VQRKPHFDGLDISGINSSGAPTSPGTFIKRLRDTVKDTAERRMMTAEDAILAGRQRIYGSVVSNHGGPAPRISGRSTIDVLPRDRRGRRGRHTLCCRFGLPSGSDIGPRR